MEATEKNKLIAEFMELEKHGEIEFLHNSTVCNLSSMKYSSSWDWLMPVIQKIHSFWNGKFQRKYSFSIGSENVSVYAAHHGFIVNRKIGKSPIKTVYESVYQTLKFHNKHTKK